MRSHSLIIYFHCLPRLCKTKRTGKCLTVELFELGLARFGCTNSGPFSRLMCIAVKPVPYARLFSDLKKFSTLVDVWNSKPKSKTLQLSDLVNDLIDTLLFAGPLTAPFLAKVLIRLGIINHPGLADQAILNERSHAYKMVVKFSGLTRPEEQRDRANRFLKSAASAIGVTPAVAENLLCEQHRSEKKWDFVFVGQPILSVLPDTNGNPTMYMFKPDGTKEISPPLCLRVFPSTEPLGRPINERWWLETSPAPGTHPVGEIVFTLLTTDDKKVDDSKRPRFPGVPRILNMTSEVRPGLIEAFIKGDEEAMLTTFNSCSRDSTYKKDLHPYYKLAADAESASRDVDLWQQRLDDMSNGQAKRDYRVLNPAELVAKYTDSIKDNGLGGISEYPIANTVSPKPPKSKMKNCVTRLPLTLTSPTPKQVPVFYHPEQEVFKQPCVQSFPTPTRINPATHSTMEIEGKVLVTSATFHATTRITPDRTESAAKRQKTAKKAKAWHKKMIVMIGKVEKMEEQERVCSHIDLVTAARDVLNLSSLSRKSFVQLETTPRGQYYCAYSGSSDHGVVDYGTSDINGLDNIGVAGFDGFAAGSDGTRRRVFKSVKASVDHMLCAIFLFHRSDHADKKRQKFMTKMFQQHGTGNKVNLVSVKKQHAKLGDNPLFGLVKGQDAPHLILYRVGLDPLILPFCCPPPHSLFL